MPSPGKKGGGPNGAHSRKTALTPTLSLSLHPRPGGKREKEREKRVTEKKRTHTHTHTRAHERAGQNLSGGARKKPAGRDRARGVRIKRKLTDSID